MSLAITNTSFPYLLYHQSKLTKWEGYLFPLSVGLVALLGTAGAVTEGSFIEIQSQLSQEIAENFHQTVAALTGLQSQSDSLARVALQNHRALDLL